LGNEEHKLDQQTLTLNDGCLFSFLDCIEIHNIFSTTACFFSNRAVIHSLPLLMNFPNHFLGSTKVGNNFIEHPPDQVVQRLFDTEPLTYPQCNCHPFFKVCVIAEDLVHAIVYTIPDDIDSLQIYPFGMGKRFLILEICDAHFLGKSDTSPRILEYRIIPQAYQQFMSNYFL